MVATFVLSMVIAAGPAAIDVLTRGAQPLGATDCPVYTAPASFSLLAAQSTPVTAATGRNGRPRPRPAPLPCAVRT